MKQRNIKPFNVKLKSYTKILSVLCITFMFLVIVLIYFNEQYPISSLKQLPTLSIFMQKWLEFLPSHSSKEYSMMEHSLFQLALDKLVHH